MFYQEGRFRKLVKAMNMHLPTIRAAVSMYYRRRVVTLDKHAKHIGHAQRGLPAGCALVTTMIQAYVMVGMDTLLATWELRFSIKIWMTIYIDDFVLTAHAKQEEPLLHTVKRATTELKDLIENDLECTISRPKAQTVASSAAVLTKLKQAMGDLAGPRGQITACNLGIDFIDQGASSERADRNLVFYNTSCIRGKRR